MARCTRYSPVQDWGQTTSRELPAYLFATPHEQRHGRVVHKQLIAHLDEMQFLYHHQYGFRRGHNTEKAIVQLNNCVTSSKLQQASEMCSNNLSPLLPNTWTFPNSSALFNNYSPKWRWIAVGYLPSRFGEVNIHRYSPTLRRIIVLVYTTQV